MFRSQSPIVLPSSDVLGTLFVIDNAVRYTPSGKDVVVRAFAEGPCAVFEVEDEGPGIPDGLRERIFEKFVQVETGAVRQQTNHGLGLTFVRMAVRAHGGDVTVRTGEGSRGTTFRVSLPRASGE